MELRHLDTLLAIAEEGSFTAAADALAHGAVERVRPGAPARGRARRAAARARAARAPSPPSSASLVLDRARRVQRELEAMHADLAMLQGLEAGHARLGVVGTASRWLVPALVADLRDARAGCAAARQRGRVGAAVRRGRRRRARAGGRHRAGRTTADSSSSTCSTRTLVGLVGRDVDAPARAGAARGVRASSRWCCRPSATRCASRSSAPPRRQGSRSTVPVEVEGIRLIADLVVAGDYASILPETAIPPELRRRADGHDRRTCHRVGSRWSTRATCSCRSPTRRCATACAAWCEKHVRVARAAARRRYGRATKRG